MTLCAPPGCTDAEILVLLLYGVAIAGAGLGWFIYHLLPDRSRRSRRPRPPYRR